MQRLSWSMTLKFGMQTLSATSKMSRETPVPSTPSNKRKGVVVPPRLLGMRPWMKMLLRVTKRRGKVWMWITTRLPILGRDRM
jgi:hypothetical protein